MGASFIIFWSDRARSVLQKSVLRHSGKDQLNVVGKKMMFADAWSAKLPNTSTRKCISIFASAVTCVIISAEEVMR